MNQTGHRSALGRLIWTLLWPCSTFLSNFSEGQVHLRPLARQARLSATGVWQGMTAFSQQKVRRIMPTLFCLGVLALADGCASVPEIHVIGDRSFQPYESCLSGDDSRAEGITVEHWRLMGRKAGFRIKYSCDTWENAQQAVLNGTAHAIGGMSPYESREPQYRFIKELTRNWAVFYYRKQDDDKVLSFQDVVDKRLDVGVVKADDVAERIKKDFSGVRFKYYASFGDVVAAAQDNEIHVFVMEEAVATYHLGDKKITHLFNFGSRLFPAHLWAAVPKDSKWADKLEEGFKKVTVAELLEIERKGVPSRGALIGAIQYVEQWVRSNPAVSVLGTFLLVYLLAVCLLFIVAPIRLFYVSIWLRQIRLQVPNSFLDLAPLRIISLIWLADTSQRVLNAWLAKRRPVILRNFSGRKTVGDRKSHYLMPFVIDGQTIEVPSVQERRHELIVRLRSIFAGRGACVSIVGEGGSGKTSLACWICDNALQKGDDSAEYIFAKLVVPIMLEGQLAQPMIDAIHTQFISLVNEEIPKEILTALMRKGHVLVVIDGFSEFDKSSRDRVESIGPTVPPFSLIVTGRRDVPVFGGMAKTELSPLPVSRTVLASFLEFLLREAGAHKKLANADFFDGCKHLSRLAGDREISPLLVVLYATLLAPMSNGVAGSAAKVSNIPDIFLEFVNRMNAAVTNDPISDVTIHRHLRTIAWKCVSKDYRPQPCLREALLPLIDETALRYLEDKLGLIETIKPTQTHVRFLLDPLVEYLAAAFLCAEGQITGELGAFLKHVSDQGAHAVSCLGLCQALADTAFAKTAVSALIAPNYLEALDALAAWLQRQAIAPEAGAIEPFAQEPNTTSDQEPSAPAQPNQQERMIG